jgi:hypothetical protein
MGIDKKFFSICSAIKQAGLSQADFQQIMNWGEFYGNLLYTNHCGIYRDDDFEKVLIESYLENCAFPPHNSPEPGSELHIISEVYSIGGHTRLLEKTLASRPIGDVLVSRPGTEETRRLKLPKHSKLHSCESGFEFEDILTLALRYQTIFLHVHPDDLKAVVAVGVARKLQGVKVILVNHADHVFSFGFFSSDTVAECSLYGMDVSKRKRDLETSFLGIPLGLKSIPVIKGKSPSSDQVHLFSGGASLKYKPSGKLSFPALAIKILRHCPNTCLTVVGPKLTKDRWWWKAKLLFGKRLNLVQKLPYDQYIQLVAQADLYIDSLPMTGGTALPEMRTKGVAVTGVICGSSGYTPADSTKYEGIDSLVRAIYEFINSQNSDLLARNNHPDLKPQTLYVHGQEAFAKRLETLVNDHALEPSYTPGKSYDIDFYHRQWIKNGTIKINRKLCKFLCENWDSGGRKSAVAILKYDPITYLPKFFTSLFLKKPRPF